MNVKRFNKKYLKQAKEMAKTAPGFVAGYKVGAVIVDRYGVIASGFNAKKTHPEQKKWSKSESKIHLHAEMLAIIEAAKNWDFYNNISKAIYIWREGQSGKPLDAMPCPVCAGALEYYGIDTIFHSGEYGHEI